METKTLIRIPSSETTVTLNPTQFRQKPPRPDKGQVAMKIPYQEIIKGDFRISRKRKYPCVKGPKRKFECSKKSLREVEEPKNR